MRTIVLKLRQSIKNDGLETLARAGEFSALAGIWLACTFAVLPII